MCACFQTLDFGTSKSNYEVSKSNSNILEENYFFLENYVTSERAVSRDVWYYQPLPNTRYQVRFNANNYFEYLSIVPSAFMFIIVLCRISNFA